jgi:hypothetical protein
MKAMLCTGLIIFAILGGCASNRSQPDTQSADDTDATSEAAAAATNAVPMEVPSMARKRLVLHMTGPDFVTKAKDWPAFQEEWRATFEDHAKEASIAFDVRKGDVHPSGDTGTLVDVYVNDYRLVGIGSRVFFGAMTGNAYIDAKATYSSLSDGKAFGARQYNTTSTAWAGVFAKMTPQQVDAIATKVFAELGVAAPK